MTADSIEQVQSEPVEVPGLRWIGQLQTVDPSEIRHKITDIQEKLHKSIVHQWRTAITGDPARSFCALNYSLLR